MITPLPSPPPPLYTFYGVLHIMLGFKQPAERGQWRISFGAGWLPANTLQRWVSLKGPVPIHYCLHTLKSSPHKMHCSSLSSWVGGACHFKHCASQNVTPIQRLSNSISFLSIYRSFHIPWS